jgi:hypothetical protein
MKGSFASGSAGRYSDVDMGVAVYDAHYESFYDDRIQFLSSVGSLLGTSKASVGRRVTVGLYDDLVEFDLTLDPLSATDVYRHEIGWILFDKTGGLIHAARQEAPTLDCVNHRRAQEIVTAFWLRAPRMRRWVAQADLPRAGEELQVGRKWLVELMLIANQPDKPHTIQRDSFVLLSPRQWEDLGWVYVLPEFTPRCLARCMLRLALSIQHWGRAACIRQKTPYPDELEKAAAAAIFQFYEKVFGRFEVTDDGNCFERLDQ